MELDRSWALAQTPPYHVYLKALHQLYASDIGGGELPLPASREALANFQIDAVKRGLGMIEEHGGCYIGDVVGLGKTFIGAELLRQLRFSYPNDGPPLSPVPGRAKADVGAVQRAFWARGRRRIAGRHQCGAGPRVR